MAKGAQSTPQYPALGRRLDLALVKKDRTGLKIDIEVDGDRYHRNPDGSRKRDDVWRDIQLQGAGWRVMRFWVYQLREDLDRCVDKILNVWSDHD
jgi:very-short-patch-repair endonuclease